MGGCKIPDELVGFSLDFHAHDHTGIEDELYKHTYSTYQWLSVRLQYLQCISNGDTIVLQKKIDIL